MPENLVAELLQQQGRTAQPLLDDIFTADPDARQLLGNLRPSSDQLRQRLQLNLTGGLAKALPLALEIGH